MLQINITNLIRKPTLKIVARKVWALLGEDTEINLQTVTVPQQSNSVYSGIYVTIFTDVLLQIMNYNTIGFLGVGSSVIPCKSKHSNVVTKEGPVGLSVAQYPTLW